jgi:hypothetical protein
MHNQPLVSSVPLFMRLSKYIHLYVASLNIAAVLVNVIYM